MPRTGSRRHVHAPSCRVLAATRADGTAGRGSTSVDHNDGCGFAEGPDGAQPRLASDPAQLADDLVADEHALRDPSTGEPALVAAAHRQQAAYRAIGQHPEWDAAPRARIPAELLDVYDRNVDARRQLTAITPVRSTLPAWRIVPPAPADQLLGFYHQAEADTGVSWNYLAAINLVETRLGSIDGVSTADAQGPMQFLPATFAAYGQGGDTFAARQHHGGGPLSRRE